MHFGLSIKNKFIKFWVSLSSCTHFRRVLSRSYTSSIEWISKGKILQVLDLFTEHVVVFKCHRTGVFKHHVLFRFAQANQHVWICQFNHVRYLQDVIWWTVTLVLRRDEMHDASLTWKSSQRLVYVQGFHCFEDIWIY